MDWIVERDDLMVKRYSERYPALTQHSVFNDLGDKSPGYYGRLVEENSLPTVQFNEKAGTRSALGNAVFLVGVRA